VIYLFIGTIGSFILVLTTILATSQLSFKAQQASSDIKDLIMFIARITATELFLKKKGIWRQSAKNILQTELEKSGKYQAPAELPK
jgi:chromosomal replication initiation ATPase DnaA